MLDREADARVLLSDVGVLAAMGIGDWHSATIFAASILINLLGCVPFHLHMSLHVPSCPNLNPPTPGSKDGLQLKVNAAVK